MENRSKNFDYFKPSGQSKKGKDPKKIRKIVWLVVKIIFYVLLFALTLGGCVQTMIVKSSGFTGAGTEFYDSSAKISPTVRTFKQSTAPKGDKNLQPGEYYSIHYSPESNFHLSHKEYSKTIQELKNQAESDGAKYGEWHGFSSSIQYLNSKNEFAVKEQPIHKGEKPNRYLFAVDNSRNQDAKMKKYESIYNNWNEIVFLDPDFKLDKIFKKEGESYTLNKEKLEIKHPENKDITVKKASLYSVYSGQNIDNPKLKYARDVLEFLYRETFLKEGNYYKRVSNISYKDLITQVLNGQKATLTSSEYEFIKNYQNALAEYLKITDMTKPSIFKPLLDKNGVQQFDKNGNVKDSGVADENLVYGSPVFANHTKLILSADEPQIAFTSFAETAKYGPFFMFLIWPIAQLTMAIRVPLPAAAGWTTILCLIVAVIITRLLVLAVTWKATMSQSMQEELRVKKAKIDAKYAEFKNNKEMRMRQQQEVSALYKKNGINPFDSMLSLIISIPIFLAMWRVIQSVPELKSTSWLGFDFAATSYKRLLSGEWWYIFLLVTTALTQVLSMLIPRLLNKRNNKHLTIEQKQAMRKNDKMQWVMMLVFIVMTVIFNAGVQIYWIITNIWSILQAIAIHFFKKTEFYKKRYNKKIVS